MGNTVSYHNWYGWPSVSYILSTFISLTLFSIYISLVRFIFLFYAHCTRHHSTSILRLLDTTLLQTNLMRRTYSLRILFYSLSLLYFIFKSGKIVHRSIWFLNVIGNIKWWEIKLKTSLPGLRSRYEHVMSGLYSSQKDHLKCYHCYT